MPSAGRHERVHLLDHELVIELKEPDGAGAAVPEDGESEKPASPVAYGDHRTAATRAITESTGRFHA
jgi:hypothetical protein